MYHYRSVEELVSEAEASGKTISGLTLEQQAAEMEQPPEAIYEGMRLSLQVMRDSVRSGADPGLRSTSGLTGGSAALLRRRLEEGNSLCGGIFAGALWKALAVSELNAAMGRIVAAPTAGSCGILPAVLLTVAEEKHIPERPMVMSLFTASAIGMVIANNACIAGAQGGCQAECGSASAMAAAAAVELMGGSPRMISAATAIALKNLLGLVCDPVAGLVEIPCIKRNAGGAANALAAAELALAGIESAIPADEVILAMKRVGDLLPVSLRETAEGGLAATPSGRALNRRVFGSERKEIEGNVKK